MPFSLRVVLLGSPEAAQAEMNSFIEEIVLGDEVVGAEEIQIDPLGDAHRAVIATLDDGEGGGDDRNFAVLGLTAGPLSYQFIVRGRHAVRSDAGSHIRRPFDARHDSDTLEPADWRSPARD